MKKGKKMLHQTRKYDLELKCKKKVCWPLSQQLIRPMTPIIGAPDSYPGTAELSC